MKKTIILTIVALFTGTMAFAFPKGCFEGTSRPTRGRCAIVITVDEFCVMSSDGSVLIRYEILRDDGSNLVVKDPFGREVYISYGVDNGINYVVYNKVVYTQMD